ncbi:MAG: hypothetical protein K2M84_00605 [Anaeroplasmataceae bacterium]|nr:hypothetical protein [Anaeroplasmataceae bacterium]MDE7384235.1 hypothetical protein [Anaeroplasmataceae bacterium]
MKEIIVNSNGNICYKVIILDNSVSFVEEYSSDTDEKQQFKTNHFNVPIADIQRIKYTYAEETIKGKTKILPFVLAGILLLVGIILFCIKILIGGGICLAVALVLFLVGFLTRTSDENSASQTLIIESEDKVLYQKAVQLNNEKLFDIINSIREKQPHLES